MEMFGWMVGVTQQCWLEDPAHRPTAAAVLARFIDITQIQSVYTPSYSTYLHTYIHILFQQPRAHKISTYKNNKRTLVQWLNERHNASYTQPGKKY